MRRAPDVPLFLFFFHFNSTHTKTPCRENIYLSCSQSPITNSSSTARKCEGGEDPMFLYELFFVMLHLGVSPNVDGKMQLDEMFQKVFRV